MQNRTVTLGTDTCDGFIKHKRVKAGDRTIDAPVQLVRAEKGRLILRSGSANHELMPVPVKAYPSGYVYVMPGGELLGVPR